METKLELVVSLITKDVKDDLNGYYKDWGIESWSEYLEDTGRTSTDFKEDVCYILNRYSNENNVDVYLNDSYELELEDGSLFSYRKLMNKVRKQLKSEGYLAA